MSKLWGIVLFLSFLGNSLRATTIFNEKMKAVVAASFQIMEEDQEGAEVPELKKILAQQPSFFNLSYKEKKQRPRVSKSPNLVIIFETKYESVDNSESSELIIVESPPSPVAKKNRCCVIS